MSGLEQTFYIMAIIFMAVMFILMVALVAAVFAIRAKIHQIERNVTEKIASKMAIFTNLFSMGQRFAGIAKKVVQHRQS